MAVSSSDTIAAIATAPGKGGVGIVRISGPRAKEIGRSICGLNPTPRHAHYCEFHGEDSVVLDAGILLFFPGPHSFTGEDVLELQGHGGTVVLDMLLQRCLQLGARLARPGEFSERAYLNDKLDLAQAEAIADLIDASSTQAARQAMRSLQGEFSTTIDSLSEQLIQLRMYVESAIDFPEEEIDFLQDGHVQQQLEAILAAVDKVLQSARQGALLREGMNVVIVGRPNAGKSSILNALSGEETAIVTEIAGTTRDTLKELIHIDGMPVHIVDTAGLRQTGDKVEHIGVQRAIRAVEMADRILLVVDASSADRHAPFRIWPEFLPGEPDPAKVTVLQNKIDLSTGCPVEAETRVEGFCQLGLSAATGEGLDRLRAHLKQCMGYDQTAEGVFSARRRHIDALHRSRESLEHGYAQLVACGAGELLAEDLRQAQQTLGEITGSFSSDDLLGRIFSSFCIGK